MRTDTDPPDDRELTCKACGAGAAPLFRNTNTLGLTIELQHARCPQCGMVFVANHLSNEQLGLAYGALDTSTYFREVEQTNRQKMMNAIKDLHHLARSSRIIDIGTGTGMFPTMLQDAGFDSVSAHEIPGEDLTSLTARGIEVYQDFDYQSIPDESQDCVTLLDVAEHVSDPLKLFTACARILRKNGILYIHTPRVTPLDRMFHAALRVPGIRRISLMWLRGRTSIFHLQNYTPQSLHILLKRAGFPKVDLRCENELSQPVWRYVRSYYTRRLGLPDWCAKLLAPVFWPLLKGPLNRNKAIVTAAKAP